MNFEEEVAQEILEDAKKEKRLIFDKIAFMRVSSNLVEDDELYLWICDDNSLFHAIQVPTLTWADESIVFEYGYQRVSVNRSQLYSGELVYADGQWNHGEGFVSSPLIPDADTGGWFQHLDGTGVTNGCVTKMRSVTASTTISAAKARKVRARIADLRELTVTTTYVPNEANHSEQLSRRCARGSPATKGWLTKGLTNNQTSITFAAPGTVVLALRDWPWRQSRYEPGKFIELPALFVASLLLIGPESR